MKKTVWMIAGMSSHVGKTTVTTGLMDVLTHKGLVVQAFKCGPDYLDPTFHEHVTHRPCVNLDLHMMGEEGVRQVFHKYMAQADVGIIEGVMGMYDGSDHRLDNGSAAHIARLLGVPILLVVDASGVSTSIAAMVKGYQLFDPRVCLQGVLINKIGSQMHYQLLVEALKQWTPVIPYGYLTQDDAVTLGSRHLGLLPSSEVLDLSAKLKRLRALMLKSIDFEALLESKSPILSYNQGDIQPLKPRYQIAVARDEAFYFYYTENLAYLMALGCEIKYFSPLHDHGLPKACDGVYIGGGYPELHAQALSENTPMKIALKKASDEGMPIYAECGGMMYLTKKMQDLKGHAYEMVGIFDGQARMTERLQRFGYVNVTLSADTLLGKKGQVFKGHEFHRSIVEWGRQTLVYDVSKESSQTQTWACGALTHNTLGAYAHLYFQKDNEALSPLLTLIDKRRHTHG